MSESPLGRGRYDDLCEKAFKEAQARGMILIVLGGTKGNGFSVTMPPDLLPMIPSVLRVAANMIEEDQRQKRRGN